MKRKIKSIKSYREEFVVESLLDDELQKVESPAQYQEFDSNGNLIIETTYGLGGQLSEKYTYAYVNNKLMEKHTYFDEEEIAESEFYEYDNNLLIRMVKAYSEGFEDVFHYEYDSQNRLLKKYVIDGESTVYEYADHYQKVKQFDENNELITTEEYFFDALKNVIKETKIIHSENESQTSIYEYDSEGELIKTTDLNGSNKVINTVEHIRNNENRTLRNISKNFDDEEIILTIFYDERNNEIGQTETINGEPSHAVKRVFDDEGRLLETHAQVSGNGHAQPVMYSVYYEYTFFEE